MIALWMGYTVLIGMLFGVGALALERALRLYARPARWVWLASLVGSLVAPGVAWLLAPAASSVAAWPAPPSGGLVFLANPLSLALPVAALPSGLDRALLLAWAALSAALLLFLLITHLRLQKEQAAWRTGLFDGVSVLISRRTGPAVVGALRSRIVLPEWAFALEQRSRALLLAHEQEHVRGRDAGLLHLGLALLAAAPWNPPLWWQVRRLRLAIELDCDARVLRRHPDLPAYGNLLLEVGRRVVERPLPAAAFAERRSLLERRIAAMTRPAPQRRGLRAAGLAAAALLLMALACELDSPEEPTPRASVTRDEPLPEPAAPPEPGDGPVFTPYTKGPELLNGGQVAEALEKHYPPLLGDAGTGGTVVLWFLIDQTGKVVQSRVSNSSGHQALDQAALRVAEIMSFSPALNRSVPVPVWIQIPIVFRGFERDASREPGEVLFRLPRRDAPSASGGKEPAQLRQRFPTQDPPATRGEQVSNLSVTPPQLQNPGEIQQALRDLYPPLLRAAGIGGQAVVALHIHESGDVRQASIQTSSGRAELDSAAVKAAMRMRFTPAVSEGRSVEVRVLLPVRFEPSRPGP